ncbi:MAG TPA: bifunctional biotin--[acetyl-CoA-carboxylase] ligase/biotin operon repressor BirA [Nevskiaceae bacterium]|nr:bifunctional biotin--[acetyl-CoA-carboxylase] ligase/biotin operon repressor BirA [Nevskiaceae bacterium]
MAATLSESELLALVSALSDGAWHSGEALAADAGITRAALAKRIAKLSAWGLDVEARVGLGYRLAQPVDLLDAKRIRRALPELARDRLRRVDVIAITDSTNQRLAEADASADPQALFAEFQSAGRGRHGREWVSPFGANVYLSLAWTFPHWPAQITALPLAIGVACARALRAQGVDGVALKWPNDLLVGGKKLGGILIEQRGEGGGACRAIVGVGINVSMQDARGITQPWTSVASVIGKTPSRNAIAAELLAQLVLALEQFAERGFAAFATEWDRLDLTRDQPVRIEAGKDSYEGVARGLDRNGALKIETSSGVRHALAGDVSLRVKT